MQDTNAGPEFAACQRNRRQHMRNSSQSRSIGKSDADLRVKIPENATDGIFRNNSVHELLPQFSIMTSCPVAADSYIASSIFMRVTPSSAGAMHFVPFSIQSIK